MARLARIGALLLLSLPACTGPAEEAPLSNDTAADAQAAWFTEITEEVGLDFLHDPGWDASYFFPEHVGSGGALFDYDGDGDLDLYLVNSGLHGAAKKLGTSPTNKLFRQEGDGRLVDRTAQAAVGDIGYGMGAAIGDYDNDGDVDLFVTNYGADRLYRNNGDGTFTNATAVAGVGGDRWSTAACFFDADDDGYLDLFVVTYVHHDSPKRCTDKAGRPEYCGPAAFRGEADLFYRNNGDGSFSDASLAAGIGRVSSKGLGLACLDLNADGRQDVYVANDGEKNELWINGGDGKFEDRSLLLGAGLNMTGQAEASMGVALGDVDGDLDLDLFLSHLDRETNTLYLNLGEGGFQDSTVGWNLGASSLPYTGFGTELFDADLDGDLDLLVVNGRVRRRDETGTGRDLFTEDVPVHWRPYAESNLFFVNDGTGRYQNASALAGELCSRVEVSRMLALGDIDRDGDLDVVLTNSSGPARLYRNDAPQSGHWTRLRAIDTGRSRDALGTELLLEAGGGRLLLPMTATHSYLASVEPTAHVGLGKATRIDQLTLRWPNGKIQRVNGLPADRSVTFYLD